VPAGSGKKSLRMDMVQSPGSASESGWWATSRSGSGQGFGGRDHRRPEELDGAGHWHPAHAHAAERGIVTELMALPPPSTANVLMCSNLN
jgi:hypothetical protein